MWSVARVSVGFASTAVMGAAVVFAPSAVAAPLFGLFGDGDNATADCNIGTCDGGNGGLIFGNGGNGANGGNGGNAGWFGNGGNGGDGNPDRGYIVGGNGGDAGWFGNGGNGGNGTNSYIIPNPTPEATPGQNTYIKIVAEAGGNGGNGGLLAGNGGNGGNGGSDLIASVSREAISVGGNGGNGGNAGMLSGRGGNGGNGGNATRNNPIQVMPGNGGKGGSGSRNGNPGADGQYGSITNFPVNPIARRTAAKSGSATQTTSTRAASTRSGRR